MIINRREMLHSSALLASGLSIGAGGAALRAQFGSPVDLRNLVGITTGSLMRNLTLQPEAGKLQLLELPKIMRDELGLRVIDLMTATMPSMEPAWLDSFREQAEKHDCIITNLKMNQPMIDMGSELADERKQALEIYKTTIDAAQRLGCRWVRPLPVTKRPALEVYVDSYRQLIEYAAPKEISLLIENFGWIQDDADAIPNVIQAVGPGLAAGPDTGNWTDEVRYDGLAKAFPFAVTCDFKVKTLGDNLEHPPYDLKRCFQIGWGAGFRGPWCFEHFNAPLSKLLKDFASLRDLVYQWTKESSA